MKEPKKASTTDAYAGARTAKLDQQTPKWPDLRVAITAAGSTISASGITHELTGDDPQRAAVTFAADHARRNGKPVRMTATMPTGDVYRMIVTPDRSVVLLDHARPAGSTTAPPQPAASGKQIKKARPTKTPARRAGTPGIIGRFPPRLQPIIKWGAPAFAVLLVVLVVLAVVKGPSKAGTDTGIAQQNHPVPPAGTLYTVTAPPGWSQTATWTVPLAHGSTTDTDPDTGVTAALTPDDRTTAQTAHDTAAQIQGHQPNYLSVLGADGSTRYTAPLATRPVYGPVITTVDGAKVVLLQTNSNTVSYWPIDGGEPTTVELPDQVAGQLNTAGTSVMVPLGNQRVAYLHNHAWQTLEALPLTTPKFATDGAVVSVQPETGAWWTQRIDSAPTSVRPTRPAGVTGLDQILAVTPQHVILSWKTAPAAGSYTASDVITAYDVATGKLLAQASSVTTLSPAQAVYTSARHGLTAADGMILSAPAGRPAALTLIAGLQVKAVYDAVYGQEQGGPALFTATGSALRLPVSALTPVGATTDRLLVVSQDQLYALPADPNHTTDQLPAITISTVPTTAAPTSPITPAPAPTRSSAIPEGMSKPATTPKQITTG